MRVSSRGAVTNLSAIRNMAYDPDPQVRKDAYEAELACYGAIADPVAYALNSIKMETISDCALRGYAAPLDRTLQHADMKRETLDAMLGAIEEYLPKFRQYLKAKAAALGHETVDDTMESHAFIEAGLRQLNHVGDGVGALVLEKFHQHITLAG